jgi:5-formyltetrahydrofolate cyclo-ligase
LTRGSEHTAPTYLCRPPGSNLPTAFAARTLSVNNVVELTKSELRQQALTKRASFAPDVARAAAQAAAHHAVEVVKALPAIQAVALYSPVRGELDCGPLARELRMMDKRVVLPVVSSTTRHIIFREWPPGASLQAGYGGILQPDASARELLPDVVFVPLAAFDARGFRIGYGKGFYDRTLPVLRVNRHVHAFGFAFAAQQVSNVPDELHDVRLDGVVTENGFLPCSG